MFLRAAFIQKVIYRLGIHYNFEGKCFRSAEPWPLIERTRVVWIFQNFYLAQKPPRRYTHVRTLTESIETIRRIYGIHMYNGSTIYTYTYEHVSVHRRYINIRFVFLCFYLIRGRSFFFFHSQTPRCI